MEYLKEYGPRLVRQGVPIVPIKAGTKYPGGIKDWQTTVATEALVDEWLGGAFGNGGVGVLCETFPAVDIDVRNPECSAAMVEFCIARFGETLQRVGSAPKTLLAYRTNEPFSKVQSPTFVDPDGDEHKVEILGTGQQYVAYAIHPDTGRPYEWFNSEGETAGLVSVDVDLELPYITQEDAQAVVDHFVDHVVPDDWVVKTGPSASTAAPRLQGEYAELEAYAPVVSIERRNIDVCLEELEPWADDYHGWVKMGMALFHQFEGDNEGFQLWDDWSGTSNAYDPHADMLAKWKSFKEASTQRPVTFASIIAEARAHRAERRLEENRERLATSGAFTGLDALLASVKPIQWIIEGYLERNTTGFLYGDPQAFKTFTAIDWALCVATGRPWKGRNVEQSPVLYISGEGHNGFARRLKAWQITHGGLDDSVPFKLSRGSFPLTDEKSAELLAKHIDDEVAVMGQVPGLIIVDTLARNFGPGNENSQEDASKFIANVDGYLRDKYGATVLILHHTGHAAKERGRGSSVISGAADFEYILNRKDLTAQTCLSGLKMKDAPVPPQMWLAGVEVPFTVEGEGEATSLVLELSEMPGIEEQDAVDQLRGNEKYVYELIAQEGPCDADVVIDIALIDGDFSSRAAVRSTIRRLRTKELLDGETGGKLMVRDDFSDEMLGF